MKRPDYFVCLNDKNNRKLREEFEIPKKIDLERYWSEVVERLTDTPWWNSPEPEVEFEKRIWRCRAAFLDVRFYNRD